MISFDNFGNHIKLHRFFLDSNIESFTGAGFSNRPVCQPWSCVQL